MQSCQTRSGRMTAGDLLINADDMLSGLPRSFEGDSGTVSGGVIMDLCVPVMANGASSTSRGSIASSAGTTAPLDDPPGEYGAHPGAAFSPPSGLAGPPGVLAAAAAAPGAAARCASSRCFIVSSRTGGCSRMSIAVMTVLSPCTKNVNENEA
uniref:Uncharacterized protein n=1 Tax=Anopheles merus TaxID=30066 RepID=A0A182VNI9_ANOME